MRGLETANTVSEQHESCRISYLLPISFVNEVVVVIESPIPSIKGIPIVAVTVSDTPMVEVAVGHESHHFRQ